MYSNHETTLYLTIMLLVLNSVSLDICLARSKKARTQSETGELLVEDPIHWSILHKDFLKRQEYADKIETILFEYADCDSHEASPTQLSEAIMYAAESTITEAKDRETNWFDASESII
jgi:hypothetical protein